MSNNSLRYRRPYQSIKGMIKEIAIYDEFLHHELGKSLDEAEDVLKKLGYTDLVRKTIEEEGEI